VALSAIEFINGFR